MKNVSLCLLAFMTFWMSTWLVTDIHGGSSLTANQTHPIFGLQQAQTVSESLSPTHEHASHCGVCSYDHGGHMGQTLVAISYVAAFIAAQNFINPLPSDFWFSISTLPKLRPPIV